MRDCILQWNINGFSPQKEHLQLLIAKTNPSIICLQKTNFKQNFCASLKHYLPIYKNRINTNHASGGVAIYIKNNLKSNEVTLNTNMEAIATTVLLPIGSITICNI